MADYPRLAEMGVLHPEHIAYFSVNSLDYNDHLRIVYERPKASLLPTSRVYKFPRVQTKLKAGDGSEDAGIVMESSPAFREAVAELESLVAARQDKENLAERILDEIRQIEEEILVHTECLKSLVERYRET